MLQLLRGKKSSLLVKIVLGLVVIGFSFFGIESYFVANVDNSVARVGKSEISQEQFRERFAQYRQRMIQMMGGAGDVSFLDRPEVKQQVLDQMVNEHVLLDANDRLGLAVAPDRVRAEILGINAFQSNGQFDPDQYRMLLASQGMTPASFEQRLRDDLAVRELPQQVSSTALVTDAEVDHYLRLKDQRRDFHYFKLPKPDAATNTEVSDADIESYFKAHAAEYMTPERISLDYVELDEGSLHVDETPDDAVLKDRYEKEKNRYVTEEQRLASHILVKVGGKGSPEDQKAALAKAEAIEKELKDGKNFADVAKKESDDLGSKAAGGDLGWLDKGTTDEAFESALFALGKGEVSQPVLGSDGYHIIELRDVRPGKVRSFEEVRTELAKQYQESERERVYAEKAGRLTDLVYQNPASLDQAAKELDLKVGKTELFPRTGGSGIAANPAVIKAAFSDSVLVQNNNSDPIEIDPNHVVVVRIAEHKPASPIALETVKEGVRARILAERLAKDAKDRADALFASFGKGETLEQVAAKHELKVEEQKGIGRDSAVLEGALVQAVFAMPRPAEGKPERKLVDLGNDEYAIVRLDVVEDGDPSKLDAKTREATRNTLGEAFGMASTQEFVSALRKNTKVKFSPGKLDE